MDLFDHAAKKARHDALATLDAWLAATDPQTGYLRPGDPGYWPPPVRIADALPPRPERINTSSRPHNRPPRRTKRTRHGHPT
jgi:hypothetical protein